MVDFYKRLQDKQHPDPEVQLQKEVFIRFGSLKDREHWLPDSKVQLICAHPYGNYQNNPLLAPSEADFRAKKAGKMSEELYTLNLYSKMIDDLARIKQGFLALPDGSRFTFCCFCKPGEYCHARVVYRMFEWLNSVLKTGYVIDCYAGREDQPQ